MIFWACSAITLAAAALATFVGDVRRSILALWIAGLGVGGIYLSLGAELLAVVQWIVSTLTAISFIFYAVMFGEYGVPDGRTGAKRISALVVPLGLGLAFAGVIWLGASGLPELMAFDPARPEGVASGMGAIGRTLADEHLLSLEILALTLFLVIVGSGVVARPEVNQK